MPELNVPHFVSDPATSEAFEAKHTPHIELEKTDAGVRITVSVGYYAPHPNEPGHFFDWLELYVSDQPIARFSGMAEVVAPSFCTVLHLEPGTHIEALAHCNLHGSWKADAII